MAISCLRKLSLDCNNIQFTDCSLGCTHPSLSDQAEWENMMIFMGDKTAQNSIYLWEMSQVSGHQSQFNNVKGF